MIADVAKAVVFVFVAALAQVAVFSSVELFGGRPDLVLVTLVGIALLRGSVVGAVAGFWGGFLLDTATLDTLGVTSLLLTIAGYWIGRYGETTARDRAHAPVLSVVVITILLGVASLALDFTLGEPAPARLLADALLPTIFLNLVLTLPLYALSRRLFRPLTMPDAPKEVRLLG